MFIHFFVVLVCISRITFCSVEFCTSKDDVCEAHNNLQVWAQSSEFTAAVVEYNRVEDNSLTPEAILKKNIDNYIKILENIQNNNQTTDIVVFPEATLMENSLLISRETILLYAVEIQDKIDGISLCNSEGSTAFLTRLACAAVTFKTYIVVNLLEKFSCIESLQTKCAEDGWNLYNTNAVLDRKGAVVAKYRKYNLFGEPEMNQTSIPEISKFKTDFGVEFGQFICFDILFRRPTLDLVREHNISHFVFSAMWFSELPFLTALQSQQQWAHEVDGVLLAAGANSPRVGSGGTGIYRGSKGPVVFDILSSKGADSFVVKLSNNLIGSTEIKRNSDVVDKEAKELDQFYLKTDDLTPYTSKLLPRNRHVKEVVCSGIEDKRICCNFDISLEWNSTTMSDTKNHYQYHMVAYSGVRSFAGVYNGGIEVCGIVACTGNTLDLCGRRFNDYDTISWPVKFTKISIRANFDVNDNKIQYPNSLSSNLKPLPVDAVEWTKRYLNDNTIVERTHTLIVPQDRLMTFAIYGRDFGRDSPPKSI